MENLAKANKERKNLRTKINGPNSPEEMDGRELAELFIDMLHRAMVHHTLWFREVEHQLGFEKALKVMDSAWEKTKTISIERFSKEFGENLENGLPESLIRLSDDKKLSLLSDAAKNWLAMDGVWFQAVESVYGMNDAKRCNDSVWGRFSPFEAHSIKRLLGIGEHPGLEGLKKALNFRLYGRINTQSCYYEDLGKTSMVFEMNECRVQAARKRKGMEDYPCKSAGLVEYQRFAEAIDSRIKTECIGCPPDKHPEKWHCAWRFYIPKTDLEKEKK